MNIERGRRQGKEEKITRKKQGRGIILRLPSQGQNIPDFFSKSKVTSNHGAVKSMPGCYSYPSSSPAPRSEQGCISYKRASATARFGHVPGARVEPEWAEQRAQVIQDLRSDEDHSFQYFIHKNRKCLVEGIRSAGLDGCPELTRFIAGIGE